MRNSSLPIRIGSGSWLRVTLQVAGAANALAIGTANNAKTSDDNLIERFMTVCLQVMGNRVVKIDSLICAYTFNLQARRATAAHGLFPGVHAQGDVVLQASPPRRSK